ncbi:glycoside hydrolase family 5 protein [Nocardioides pacificus]
MRRWRAAVLLALACAAALAVWVAAPRLTSSQDPGAPDGSPTGSAGPGTGTAPRPVVDGDRLVDRRTGETFIPRGVNWSGFEYPCAQGWALSALVDVVAQDPAASEARLIADWGATTVRIPLNQDCWLGTREAPVDESAGPGDEPAVADYRAEVVGFVDALNQAGLVAVLDLHSRKRAGEPEFGNLAMPDEDSLAFWTSVATTFRDHPSVMFDAFNEPYSRFDDARGEWAFELTWACWRDGGCTPPAEDDRVPPSGATYTAVGMADVVAAIREAGARQPVLLGGLDYANDLSGWLEHRPYDDQLVAAMHSYDFKQCGTRECWDAVLTPLAQQVPLITAELGAEDPSSSYVADYLAWAEETDTGVLFWVWARHGDDPMSLLDAGSDTPRSPYGQLVASWLRSISR